MTNTQTVRIDLTSPGGFAPVIHAVAGDIYSRFVRMELYQNGVLYEPPSGTTCVIGWRRGETYGAYSSILEEDGSSSHPMVPTAPSWRRTAAARTPRGSWRTTS